jgi:hypothetical protein
VAKVSKTQAIIVDPDSLLSNSLKRCLVVEAEVASVDDVVSAGRLGEFIQGSKVACAPVVSKQALRKLDHSKPGCSHLEHLQCRGL